MEIFIETMHTLLIPQVVAALIGGLIGASINIKVELYGWRLSILFAIGSLVSAGAIAEYITYIHSINFIFLHCVLGILVGILGNSLLNAIYVEAPDFTGKLVNVLSEGIIELVKEVPKYIISKFDTIFEWLKLIIRNKNNEK